MSSEDASEFPAGYRGRPLSLDDIAAIAGVWRRCDAAAGFPNATLSVDSENTTGAIELYRTVGTEPIRETLVFRRVAS